MITNVCVCVCFYNTNPRYLEECFKSIDIAVWMFKRYYEDIPIEVHVMDDGTDDINTFNMFENIRHQYNYIKLWRHDHNTTLATAINDLHKYTPEHALVIYIDSDDMMMPNRIMVQYEVMAKNNHWKNITLCATNTCSPSYMINQIIVWRYEKYHILFGSKSMEKNLIVHPSICYKIDDLRFCNIKYDDNIKCLQDFDFYLQILHKNLSILLLRDSLTWYRQYPLEEKPDSKRDYHGELKKLQIKYKNPNLKLTP